MPQKNFVVYKSSAGSGKTYTLVKAYLKLVIEHPERYANILAITFTNKASNEMKSRILESLKMLSGLSADASSNVDKPLIKSLCDELNMTPEGLSSRAETALRFILHNYSNFAVSTIDSFVYKLVRSFARDLRLPANFEVELDTDKLIGNSIDLLVSKVGADPELTAALVSFIETRMDDEKSWNIERQLKDFTLEMLKEDSYDAIKQLSGLTINDFIEISKKLLEHIRAFEREIVAPAKQAIEQITAAGLTSDAFFQTKSGIYAYFSRVANGDLSKLQPNSYVLKSIDENKWCSGKCTADESDAIFNISDDLTGFYSQIQQVKHDGWQTYNLSKLLHGNIFLVAVLSEIEKVMEEFRENENIVHISEFNKRISAIVQREAVPFIYERIGERYRHYLLDEFQDTSILQWHNLLPLLENALSAGNFNMIVGDGKQAIYRWRNGEVEQFSALPQIFKNPGDVVSAARENLLVQQHEPQYLNTNYRSRSEIVGFNNAFFEFVKSGLSPELSAIYDAVTQETLSSKIGGYVQIEFLKTESGKNEDYRAQMLDRTLSIVQENLKDVNPSDIAVLVRRNLDGSEVAQRLMENGISVVSNDVLVLSASPVVRFLISFLRFMHSPDNSIAAAEILTFLYHFKTLGFAKLNDLLMTARALNPKDPAALPLIQLLADKGYTLDNSRLAMSPLPEVLNHIIAVFQLDENGNDPFVQFFMDMVYDFNTRYNEPLPEFLKYWDDTGSAKSIVIPEATPSVKVMTIHKAKGLQFPVVIYPFAQSFSRLSKKHAWIKPGLDWLPELQTAMVNYNKTMEDAGMGELYSEETGKSFLDTLNLMYVAMTRAEERLFVISKDKTNDKDQWKMAGTFHDQADLLYQYIQDTGWEPDQMNRYCKGTRTYNAAPSDDRDDNLVVLTASPKSRDWRQHIKIRLRAPLSWDTSGDKSPREMGLLVHRALSLVKSKHDVDRAIALLVNDGQLHEDQAEQLRSAINELINKPDLSPCFEEDNMVMNEREILLKNGDILRPDRIVIKDNKAVVIDYKTGKEDPSHLRQLDSYAEALTELGYENVEKRVVYVGESA
jgi:ATP-dependent exoDNAse (exonuclease V) beta subunit